MRSSEPGSERRSSLSPTAFIAAVMLVTVAALAGIELYIRTAPGVLADRYAAYVKRVLEYPGRNVLIGDSHLLPVGSPQGWINLARGGLAASEEARVLSARLKFLGIDKVVIESGPQILTSVRQVEFRALPPETLTRQIFPEPVLFVEPAILRAAVASIAGRLTRGVSRAFAEEGGEGARTGDQEVAGNAAARARFQRPVGDFRNSLAWHRHWDIVERLREAGAEVCLVQAPVSRIYLEMARQDPDIHYFPALEAMIAEANRRGVRFVAVQALEAQFPDEMFSDIDHMTRDGARIFWSEVVGRCFEG